MVDAVGGVAQQGVGLRERRMSADEQSASGTDEHMPAGTDEQTASGAGSTSPSAPPAVLSAYEWCVLRVVPRVERCEFVNAGIVVYSQTHEVLASAVELDDDRVLALAPDLDLEVVQRHLALVAAVCAGEHAPTAHLPLGQRFRWLTAPRSTMVQTSPVHTGLTADPLLDLAALLDRMVRLRPGPPSR